METQLQYKLPVFEGPLDLLLTLISKNKIDIYDIRISDLLDQYMEQINRMQEDQMDIASEFLTMASRLVYIKSVMLLPKYEEEAEELKKNCPVSCLSMRFAEKLPQNSEQFMILTPITETLRLLSMTLHIKEVIRRLI